MAQSKPTSRSSSRPQQSPSPHATISARWLLTALAICFPAALFCTWTVFCLLFWQGSWQLLYHPASAVTHNPSNIGLAYDQVSFAASETGVPPIQGWWIPGASARYTALYLHDRVGNLGDTLDSVAELHASGMNVLAFDYRGYGQSRFVRPSETSWQQDATSALDYLTGTRHIDPHSVVIVGSGLGANLALEIAASHQELAGVVLDSPIEAPVKVIFDDARAKLVPAKLLVRDRYDLAAPAATLRTPSLWLMNPTSPAMTISQIYGSVNAPKLRETAGAGKFTKPLRTWLAGLDK